jgi:hypothetical protein
METWAIFTGTDLALAVIGLVGFASVAIVMATASGNVAKREITLRKNATLQSDASDS